MSRALFVVAALLIPAEASAQSELSVRTIEADIVVRSPSIPCQIPGLVMSIGISLKIPAGVEAATERCQDGKGPVKVTGRTPLRGMTVREAMDTLVRADPRYRWVESDGVIVLRPIEAWEKRDHFLHQSVSQFALKDEDVEGALAVVVTALRSGQVPANEASTDHTPHADHRFSVTLGATSIYEALNAIVKAHGELVWQVSYCQPPTVLEHASIGFFFLQGTGLGGFSHRIIFSRRQDGTTYDPCPPR